MEGFGELLEERLEVAVFGVFLCEAFALIFGLGFGGFATGFAIRGRLLFRLKSDAQTFVCDPVEFFWIATRVEIAEVQVKACVACGLLHHDSHGAELLFVALVHLRIFLIRTQLLDDGLQLVDFLLVEAHGIDQQIARLGA